MHTRDLIAALEQRKRMAGRAMVRVLGRVHEFGIEHNRIAAGDDAARSQLRAAAQVVIGLGADVVPAESGRATRPQHLRVRSVVGQERIVLATEQEVPKGVAVKRRA